MNSRETREAHEWRERFLWLDPSSVDINVAELSWKKLSQADASRSFEALERMRPYLNDDEVQTRAGALACRDKLSALRDRSGNSLFNDGDLRFFDLYFGNDHIRMDSVNGSYDVINGRHRLWLARQRGVLALPVRVNERVVINNTLNISEEAEKMGGMEMRDIENEAKEQHEQADEMQSEVEQHKERAEKLEAALREIRATIQDVGSDELRKAEASAEKARGEVERSLKEIKDRRDKLLQENKQLADKILKVNDGRRRAQQKTAMLMASFSGASGEFRGQVERINDSLTKDLSDLAHAETELHDVRAKLESLDV